MPLTGCQETALRTIVTFLKDERARLAIMTGPAGSGKTTLIRMIAGLARDIKLPLYVLAPTGKAALRVREATGEVATTIHRFLYSPRENVITGDVSFDPRPLDQLDDARGGLVVIDEASMVAKRVWHHLSMASAVLDLKVLLVGDPFQLEPVQDAEDAAFAPLLLPTPYVCHLDEVVRQALDSPVLRAATEIRCAKTPIDVSRALGHLTSLTGSRTPVDVVVEDPTVPIICHRNVTRHRLNAEVRARRGLAEGTLDVNEPLLVLRNNYNVDRYNGEIVRMGCWTGEGVREAAVHNRTTNEAALLHYRCGYLVEQDPAPDVKAVVLCMEEVAGTLRVGEHWAKAGAGVAWKRGELGRGLSARPQYLSASYGYAATCHKMQGSEYERVMVVLEPSVALHDISGRRWAYTSITRAKSQVYWTFA